MKTQNTIIGLILCLNLQAQVPADTTSNPILHNYNQNLVALSAGNERQNILPGGLEKPVPAVTTAHSQSIAPISEENTYGAFMTAGLFATTDGTVPFWMRSRRFGSIPADGLSASIIAGAHKEYDNTPNQLFAWGAGVEARFNAASNSELILIEGYTKGRLGVFQLKAGRFRETTGLVDSTLSSGAFSVSGNALGIPQIQIGFPDYWDVPLTNGVFALKWSLVHGWMGTYTINDDDGNLRLETYLHQKSIYGRLGKPSWKVKFYAGLNHQVTWGNEKQIYPSWGLSNFETYKYVFLGKAYGTSSIPESKVGNHLGSIDQAMEWDMKSVLFTGYHQFFYDIGGLAKLSNAKDGLWGISLKNKSPKESSWQWQKFLVEFLYSKSQGGEVDSKPRPSGAEDYYNNFLYYEGWSYQGENLGNPLFTTKKYIQEGYPAKSYQYYPNNRLMAFHGGADFSVYDWQCRALLTYSVNWGTYSTSPAERSLGDRIVYHDPPYFPEINQFSALVETRKPLRNGFELGLQFAIDQGDLLYNSVGGGVTLTKRW
ncbi:capsule assembly protein Wzi [Mangrovibacterium diazotrophicum]|uniref:Capsule assembly protein Wzi n=2 Tax=Mangrovibacterium diazotrophicum TaxID=1261403 RepID=A0A419W920_9BACT|nr:capsule assembly protein Wzi [Mangrovibacterium diazotrophicum]